MRLHRFIFPVFLLALNLPAAALFAQQDPAPPPAPAQESSSQASAIKRLAIEVTGGDANKPVENASVYVKYVEEHIIRKDKKVELNVKTSREGLAHIPNAPLGRALVQVIAEGWKTYGEYYDVSQTDQTINITLGHPPKWY